MFRRELIMMTWKQAFIHQGFLNNGFEFSFSPIVLFGGSVVLDIA
jgi:hypothetical protein